MSVTEAHPQIRFIDLHQDMLSGVGRLDGGFPAYGTSYLTGPSYAVTIWSSFYPHEPGASLLEQLEAHEALLGSHAPSLRLVTTTADLDVVDGRVGVLPHSEGFHLPDTDASTLEWLWVDRSLRSMSLTWNYETDYAFSCYDDRDAPLKPAGRALVRSLAAGPMLLDLSHLNEGGFYEALELYAPRVLVTHSFARAIGDHPRGLTDDQLRALRDHTGLVGLAFVPDFLGTGSVDEALRHIEHIATLVGEDAVSIGSDWGVTTTGELSDPGSLARLLDAVARTWGTDLAERFAFTNADGFLRARLPLAG